MRLPPVHSNRSLRNRVVIVAYPTLAGDRAMLNYEFRPNPNRLREQNRRLALPLLFLYFFNYEDYAQSHRTVSGARLPAIRELAGLRSGNDVSPVDPWHFFHE